MELRKGRTGQPEVDGLSLVNRREDLKYFFLLSLLSHLSVSWPNTDVWKEKRDDCVRVATLSGFGSNITHQARKVEDQTCLNASEAKQRVRPKIA